jgi:hypothetical protein
LPEKEMESETASSVDEQVGGGGGASVVADTRGKHRILAELKRVEQEMKFLEVGFDFCHFSAFCFWMDIINVRASLHDFEVLVYEMCLLGLFYRKILFVMNVAASLAYSILDNWK